MFDDIFEFMDKFMTESSEITANRLSIINGRDDFTQWGSIIEEQKEQLFERYSFLDDADASILGKCILQIILAEIYYQKNDCYESLVLVNSTLAFLEGEGKENIWIVARFFQMCIMIVTGQVSAIYPLVDSMETRIHNTKNQELIANYEALRAWCALYDDEKDVINTWMTKGAPNEYDEIQLKHMLAYKVKARVYFMQGKYLANYTLLHSLINTLEKHDRQMGLCEVYMLLALNFDAEGRKTEAYDYFEKSLAIARERQFIRLLADEGEAMYQLSKEFRRKTATKDPFLNKIVNASKEMALMYPKYLKKYKDSSPRITKKEKEILLLLAEGRSNLEIAEFLDNTPNTIKHHLKNIYRKFGVNKREEAITIAKKEGLI